METDVRTVAALVALYREEAIAKSDAAHAAYMLSKGSAFDVRAWGGVLDALKTAGQVWCPLPGRYALTPAGRQAAKDGVRWLRSVSSTLDVALQAYARGEA